MTEKMRRTIYIVSLALGGLFPAPSLKGWPGMISSPTVDHTFAYKPHISGLPTTKAKELTITISV